VIIPPGVQTAMAAVCRYLGSPGDPIVLESPTYIGALAATRSAGLHMIPVPTDEHGVLPDASLMSSPAAAPAWSTSNPATPTPPAPPSPPTAAPPP